MNFFEQQDRARRQTRWLLVLLVAAVVSLIIVTVVAVTFVLYFLQVSPLSTEISHTFSLPPGEYLAQMLRSELTVWVSIAVILVVLGGSVYKTYQLRGSGQKVAEALGGTLLHPNAQDPAERRILNVVEEMAIASGSPVPLVYVLEDPTINAFAAGMDRRSAVIGITRGCIEQLDRNELQGVIAHEFSHIHFGDMRINLRLVGILHGILLIGLIGSHMVRSRSYGFSSSSSQRRGRQFELGMGLILVVLGYVGVFFGNMIKAAVSRQREYLADASAVQFTRNPAGIANALKKIAAAPDHSYLSSPHAPDFNHFYFSQGVKSRFRSLFATHPPLTDRIKRVEPGWNGSLTETKSAPQQETARAAPQEANLATPAGNAILFTAIDQAGQTTASSVAQAHTTVTEIGPSLRDAAHEPFSARALIYGLLLAPTEDELNGRQLAYLQKNAHPVTFKALMALLPQIRGLTRELKLPMMEMSIPALKLQSRSQYGVFKRNLTGLIALDQETSLFEWCLYRSITHSCEEKTVQGVLKLKDVLDEARILATATLSCSREDVSPAEPPLSLDLGGHAIEISTARVSVQELNKALTKLCQLHPLEKPKILKLLAACITADNHVSPEEMELFRAVADVLNCPVPLFDLIETLAPRTSGRAGSMLPGPGLS